jgi:hypothetical protein
MIIGNAGNSQQKPMLGRRYSIIGTVEEYIKRELTGQEWITLQFENSDRITINIKHCVELKAEIECLPIERDIVGYSC